MEYVEVISPLDGQFLDRLPCDTPESIKEKITKAQTAFPAWNRLGVKKRSQFMYAYLELLRKNTQEFITCIHQENGKTEDEATAEVEKCIELTEFACSMPQLMSGQTLEVSEGVECSVQYQALGVVASIVPFNFPLMIPHWTVPIALMAGNTMILKPSELVPLSSELMLKLFKNIGLPDGVLQTVNGGKETVAALCEDPHIQAISFVGSTPVAQTVYRMATSHLKRALCLGGAKNHLIVLPDADPSMTAANVVASFSGMAGQRCMAASVMVTVGDCEKVIKEVIREAIVCGKNLGAVISKQAKERIENYIAQASQDGAQILLDGRAVEGKKNGFYIGPTILDHVTPQMRISKEEVFGPVLSIIRTKTVDEAIALQNSSPYGNGASVYTSSGGLAKYVRERLSAGMIGINIGVPVPREPFSFGGMKASKFGVGDITGVSSIHFWTQLVKCTTKWNKEASVNWMS